MMGFLIGLLIGGAFGALAMGLVAGGKNNG